MPRLALILLGLALCGCGGDTASLDIDAVEAGLQAEVAEFTTVNDVICVATSAEEAECSVEFIRADTDTQDESVIDVRCDDGSCIWTEAGDRSEGGGFELSDEQ